MTPEQSRAQVVDALRDVVHALDIHYVSATFWHSSCNDDGVAPFRGEAGVSYPLAASFAQADAETDAMVHTLQTLGWTGDPNFHSHAPALKKNNVVVEFDPQNASTPYRGLSVHGECRDMTTTKSTKGSDEHLALS